MDEKRRNQIRSKIKNSRDVVPAPRARVNTDTATTNEVKITTDKKNKK